MEPQSALRLPHRAKHYGLIVCRQSKKKVVGGFAIEGQKPFKTLVRVEHGPGVAKFIDCKRSFGRDSWRHCDSEAHGVASATPCA